MARFNKETARSTGDYVAIYETAQDLLKEVHHFGFDDIVEQLGLEAWAAHIRWDWIREFLEQDLDVFLEQYEDEDGEQVEYRRINDPTTEQIESPPRKLEPLAAFFFVEKKRLVNNETRRAMQHGQQPDLGVALSSLQAQVVNPAKVTKRDKKRNGIEAYYATGGSRSKATKGLCDSDYCGHSFRDYGKNKARNVTLSHAAQHNRRCTSEGEKLLPKSAPKLALEASNV
jgi:hypothetical protein